MNELRRFFPHQLWRYLVCGALGCLVPVQVMAYVANMPDRLDRFNTWSNGNIVSTKYAHDAALGAIRHAQSGAVSGTATTGGVNLAKQIGINTRNGVVTMTATQRMAATRIAQALRAASGGPWGLALLGAASVASLLGDAGVRVEDGQLQKRDPESCVSNCFTYSTTIGTTPVSAPSLSSFCSAYQGAANSYGNPQYTLLSIDSAGHRCYFRRNFTSGSVDYVYIAPTKVSRPADPETWVEASPAEFETAVANANPSPEVLRDLVQIGNTVPDPDPADQTAISNPQPSPTKTTTKTNPDGSTETTQCETIGLLESGNIRLVEECTVTQRDPSGNVTSTTETTTDQADPIPQEEEQSLFCELFPNVLACAEFGEPEGDEIPTEERSVDFEPELLFGNGSCPADTSITVNGTTITIGQWSSWCPYLTDYVRPMVLLLSAFMALMIVARGMPE